MKGSEIRDHEVAHTSGADANQGGRDIPQQYVNVIATTPDGTIAALQTATRLAPNLGTRIALLHVQVVPSRFSLDQPPMSVTFLQKQLWRLVRNANILDEKIRIQIHICPDRYECLRRLLSPRSLVVMGGKQRWWAVRERKLANFLRGLGHDVVSVAANKTPWPSWRDIEHLLERAKACDRSEHHVPSIEVFVRRDLQPGDPLELTKVGKGT